MTWPGGGQDQQGQQPQQWGQPAPQPQPQQAQPQQAQYSGFGQGGYGGLGAFDQQPPKKKGKHTKAVLFSGLGVVLVAAVVVTVVLLTNGTSPQATPPTTPAGSTTPSKEIAKGPEPVREAARNPGWQVVANSVTKLLYEVPPTWKPAPPADTRAALGTPGISTLAMVGSYKCGDRTFSRGVTGMLGLKPKEGGAPLEADKIASDYANGFASTFYAHTKDGKTQRPQVKVGQPKPVQRKGATGVVLEATATTAPGEPCMAASGKVLAIAFVLKPEYAVVMVANADTVAVPGHESVPTATDDELNKIIDSFRIASE